MTTGTIAPEATEATEAANATDAAGLVDAADAVVDADCADAAEEAVNAVDPAASPFWLPGTILSIAGLILVAFCLHVAVVSQLTYARSQQLSYDELRASLVAGTAPVGATFVEEPETEAAKAGDTTAASTSGTEAPEPAPPPVPRLLPAGTPVALMSVPAIGLRDVVVLEDTTSGVTKSGPGHQRTSAMPGQVGWSVIFGRRWSSGGPFREVPTLLVGDDITFTTGQGEHRYEVTGFRGPGDPEPIRKADEARLVLITADGKPFMPEDPVYVDAILQSEVKPAGAAAVFPANEAAAVMHGDRTSWFAITLWTQGLALAVGGIAWARGKWGRRQAWLVGVPLVTALGLGLADSVTNLLPNLL